MRILLTGASGLLGRAIQEGCTERSWLCRGLGRDFVNLRHPREVDKRLDGFDTLIHAAANTNVDGCEADPEGCYRDNALLTEILARAAANCGKKFVYISSTGIYGDYQEQPFNEYDWVFPTTHHHRAKYLGEVAALKSVNALVVRTGWLFGGLPENKKNFVARRIEEAVRSNGIIHSNNEQFGSPTFVNDVARYLLQLIEDGQSGVFNCVNEGFASRMSYVGNIVKLAGIPVEVRPSSANSFKRLAKVSNNEMAINLKLRQCGYDPLPEWSCSLEVYIKTQLSGFVDEIRSL